MGNLIQKNERNRFSTAGAGSARGTGSCRAGSYDQNHLKLSDEFSKIKKFYQIKNFIENNEILEN